MTETSCCAEDGTDAATSGIMDVEREVLRRYKAGAESAEAGLCCPTEYDKSLLDFLPREIVEKDYGCGDPSAYVRKGESVLDLGSGSGKICYILSQKVGPEGRVVGVDFNKAMLDLSRTYLGHMKEILGYGNVEFLSGKIQDLALNLDRLQEWLDLHPVGSTEDLAALEAECERLRLEETLIPSESIDVVVSNCVLNLVRPQDKTRLFGEIHRVLRRGGRAVISDVVCDEDPTPEILRNPELWSGCIAGAFREDLFLKRFEDAGFYGIEVLKRQEEPWQTIDGIEFRSMTVQAFKGKEGPCMEKNQAVVYRGPWKTVCDDDGHTLRRGERMAVCDKTFSIMTDPEGPYDGQVVGVPPLQDVPEEEVVPYDGNRPSIRHARETKGLDYSVTTQAGDDCCGGSCGC